MAIAQLEKSPDEIVSCALALATPLKPSSLQYLVDKPAFTEDSNAWFELLEFSNRNGTSAQVARSALSSDWKSLIPLETAKILQEKVHYDDELRALVESEMNHSIQILLQYEISFALIKGLDLARRFYPSVQDRAVDAVDLLVSQSQNAAALQVLIKNGYEILETSQSHCVNLSRSAKGVRIRLYSSLSALDNSTMAGEIWNRTEAASIPGLPKEVRALAREDHIALLITEAAGNKNPSSPIFLNDLHCLIQGEKVDWEELIWSLADRRALSAGWFTFSVLHKEYLTDISEKALDSLAHSINPAKKRSMEKTQLETEMSAEELAWSDGIIDRMRFGIQHGGNPFHSGRPR